MNNRESNFWIWLAHHLPKKLIYFCANELVASVTCNELSTAVVPDVRAMDALGVFLKRYNNFEKEKRNEKDRKNRTGVSGAVDVTRLMHYKNTARR